MKIIISQQEFVSHRSFKYDALERAYYDFLSNHTLIPAPNKVKLPDNDYDCLVLTGGPDSVARNKTETLLFKNALEKRLPIVGICHGAFTINDIAGGQNGNITGHDNEDIDIVMEGQKHKVRCYHSQSIETLAPNYISIAKDVDGNIEAFEHDILPIYGILWHPERMDVPILPQAVKKLFY